MTGQVDETTNDNFKLIPPTEPSVSAFYGLPNIHKSEPIPLRPITSSIGSVTYKLAKYLTKILSPPPLVGQFYHHVTNTQDFVKEIKDTKLGNDEIITSYDVTALFTFIPPSESLRVTKECLEKDNTLEERTNWTMDQIMDGVQIYLETTYFSNIGKFYRQLHGRSMRSTISSILTN